jgi:hypothetical protein
MNFLLPKLLTCGKYINIIVAMVLLNLKAFNPNHTKLDFSREIFMASKFLSVGIFLIYLIFFSVISKTVFNYVGKEDRYDKRQLFIKDVLKLALIKTSEKHGDFSLITNTSGENAARLFKQMDKNVYKNFFFNASITNDILAKYHVIKFPVDRGLTSFRVAFISSDERTFDCKKVNLENIKRNVTIQGIGWLDTDILKFNGFNVYAISHYKQMFKMIEKSRASFFFRGINEIQQELNTYPSIKLEPCFALHYQLPKFFITNKENIRNAKRIELGLKKAFEDGSYQQLWDKYFKEVISLSNINERQIFELDNPFISKLTNHYQKYNFKLIKK